MGIEDHHTLDVIKLVRYGINGVGDTTFGIHGIVTTPINQSSRGYSTTIQTDGKILVAGSTYDDTIWRFATVRYNPGSVGLYEITVSDSIRVFPNPTTGKITVLINQSSFTSKSVLTIYDIRGQTVWQQRIYQMKTEVDLKGLPKGIYLLKLENSGNTKIARIVKE